MDSTGCRTGNEFFFQDIYVLFGYLFALHIIP